MPRTYTLQQIADHIGADVRGDSEYLIEGLNTLQEAASSQLSFLANKTYRKYLSSSQAGAVILNPAMADEFSGNALLMANPYLGYALTTELFDDTPRVISGVHPSAVIAESAVIHPEASIGPHAVIGEHVSVGAATVVGAGCMVSDHSSIGSHGWLAANVCVYHRVSIGDYARIHSGAVVGSDGFGFAPNQGQWQKIHQLGGVVIGDNVEIGACTTIDRGDLSDTIIEDGVILDNHVMIAHNARVGKNTAMAAYTGISGSTTVGENCIFGGRSGAVGHITVCDGVQVNLNTTLTKSVTEPGNYCAGTPVTKVSEWRKNAARFNQLDVMNMRLKALENHQK